MTALGEGAAFGVTLAGVRGREVRVVAVRTDREAPLAIVGLSDTAARETRVRVRAALAELGLGGVASDGVTVSVEGLPKHGDTAALDLPIVVAVLRAFGRSIASPATVFFGELDLAGGVRPARGSYARVRDLTAYEVVTAPASAACLARTSASFLDGPGIGRLRGISHVGQLLRALPDPEPARELSLPLRSADLDALPPHLQVVVDRCVSERRVLLLGPAGAGKTMIARRIAGELPRWTREEALESYAVHDAAGIVPADRHRLSWTRPFRAPHHTVSEAALIGGPRPGEVSLAHHGVLFLDEFPELRRAPLEALGHVLGAEASEDVAALPARPAAVVASASACPCGHLGSASGRCACSSDQTARYMTRVDELARMLGITCRITLTVGTAPHVAIVSESE